MYKNKTIILANGAFPKSKELLEILDAAKQIVCCDGAVNKLIESGREPDVIIGDLDSVLSIHKKKYTHKLIQISDQNTNDLTKAVEWCMLEGINDFAIMGATGEREDHTIANIALLSKYAEQNNVRILSDNGIFIPISKPTVFQSFKGQQVSIFSQSPEVEISSEGLKYPLQNLKLNSWWMGTLNESISEEFTIRFKDNARLIIYLLNK